MRQLVMLVLCASAASAQEPRPLPFRGSGERLPQGFTSVSAVTPLPDGRVVVVDAAERTVSVGDFPAKLVHVISRRGSGPLEYLQPRRVFSLANGETLVSDPANARFLRLSADGRALGPWQAVSGPGQQRSMENLSATWDARAIDKDDRLYFELLPSPLKPGASATVPIVRLDPARGRADTVARYALESEMQTQSATSGGRGTAIIRPRAWPARPEWVVSSSGTVVIINAAPYRVSFINNGQRLDGPPIVVTPLRVTDADRSAFSEAVQRQPRGPSSPGPQPPRPAGAPPPTRKQAGAPIFPETFPPFSGRDAVHLAPSGRVWVSRSLHATDSVQVVDVFDTDGRLIERIALPPSRRLLAIGADFIYLAFRDMDDLEFVERYSTRAR